MQPVLTYPDRPLRAKLRELGLLSREQEAGLPQFLILAPECVEARRVAQVVQHHPGCALADALGTRFFSSRHQSCNLDWYVRTLGDDVHLVRGEWTPSYSLVPVRTIRLIQELLPQLKLVFLLRDPAVEAWHAWKAAQDAGLFPGKTAGIWPWARADGLGQLRRWKAVFPAEQFCVAFVEQFNIDPAAFLKRLFEFLGVDAAPSEIPKELRPVAGDEIPVAEVALLREACRARIEELAEFLAHDFACAVPGHWMASPIEPVDSVKAAQLEQAVSPAFKHEFDDVALSRAVESDEGSLRRAMGPATISAVPSRNASNLSAIFKPEQLAVVGDLVPRLVREGHCGFNIVSLRRQFYAIPQATGDLDLTGMSDAALDARVNAGEFLRGRSLEDAERAVDIHLAGKRA